MVGVAASEEGGWKWEAECRVGRLDAKEGLRVDHLVGLYECANRC